MAELTSDKKIKSPKASIPPGRLTPAMGSPRMARARSAGTDAITKGKEAVSQGVMPRSL